MHTSTHRCGQARRPTPRLRPVYTAVAQRKSRDLTGLRLQLLRGSAEVGKPSVASVDGGVHQKERPPLPSDTAKNHAVSPSCLVYLTCFRGGNSFIHSPRMDAPFSSPSRLHKSLAPPDPLLRCYFSLRFDGVSSLDEEADPATDVSGIDRQWVACRVVVREHPLHLLRPNMGTHTSGPSSSGRPSGRMTNSHGRVGGPCSNHRSIKWTVDRALQLAVISRHVAVLKNAPRFSNTSPRVREADRCCSLPSQQWETEHKTRVETRPCERSMVTATQALHIFQVRQGHVLIIVARRHLHKERHTTNHSGALVIQRRGSRGSIDRTECSSVGLVLCPTESWWAASAQGAPSECPLLESWAVLLSARAHSVLVGGAPSLLSGERQGQRVTPRSHGRRRKDSPDLKSGCASHKRGNSIESHDMVALCTDFF